MTFINRAKYVFTAVIVSLLVITTAKGVSAVAYGNEKDSVTVEEKYINMEDIHSTNQSSVLAQVVDVKVNEDQKIRVGVTEEYSNVNYTNINTAKKLSITKTNSTESIDVRGIVDKLEIAQKELDEEAERLRIEAEKAELAKAKAALAKRTYSTTQTQGGLLDISHPDSNYTGRSIKITGEDRKILERLVMGEAGNQGFEGAALVAQCIRDMYILGGFDSIESVRRNCGYSASLKRTPNQNVLDAVTYIFDEGGYAVKHRMLYFYAPKITNSSFHESQNLIINYKDHKFFDRRK